MYIYIYICVCIHVYICVCVDEKQITHKHTTRTTPQTTDAICLLNCVFISVSYIFETVRFFLLSDDAFLCIPQAAYDEARARGAGTHAGNTSFCIFLYYNYIHTIYGHGSSSAIA